MAVRAPDFLLASKRARRPPEACSGAPAAKDARQGDGPLLFSCERKMKSHHAHPHRSVKTDRTKQPETA
jgi:hypothetical protein